MNRQPQPVWYKNKYSVAPTSKWFGANYIDPTDGDVQGNLATRRGGLRFLLGLLIREFGYDRVKEDFLLLEAQHNYKKHGGKFN